MPGRRAPGHDGGHGAAGRAPAGGGRYVRCRGDAAAPARPGPNSSWVPSAGIGPGCVRAAATAATAGGSCSAPGWPGVGVNYAALTWQAALLSRPGALEAELAGADLPRELRRYSYLQLWVVVPLLLAVLALRQRARGSGQGADTP